MLALGVANCQDRFWQPSMTGTIAQYAEQVFKVTLYKWNGKKYHFLGEREHPLCVVK